MRSAANSLEQCVLVLPGTFVRFGVFWWVAAASVNGGVKFGHCGGAKVGQFGASALERAALI